MTTYTFDGFRRPDGSVGTRSYVAVMASVICSTTPVQQIADRMPGALAVVHPYGCAQVGDDLQQTRRTLIGVSCNPNVAATLIVGLGCENNQPAGLAELIRAPKPVDVIGIQQLGGSEQVVDAGSQIVERRLAECAASPREQAPISALHVGVVGYEMGDEISARQYEIFGALIDALVNLGAQVTVGVDKHLAPAGARLAERAETPEGKARLLRWGGGLERLRWQDGHALSRREWDDAERRRAESAAALTGSARIQSVVTCAEATSGSGLHVMGVPSDSVEAMSGLVAGGATLLVVLSGRGILSGAVGAPTLVVAPGTGEAGALDVTVDAHLPVGESNGSGEKFVSGLVSQILSVASGEVTRLEEAGLHDFAISKVSTPF